MKIFVVSPHPDDETLGCGGTLLKHKKNNDQIFWNIVTKPLNEKTNKKREKEITKVATKYNIKKIIRANYTTAELKKKDIYKLIN